MRRLSTAIVVSLAVVGLLSPVTRGDAAIITTSVTVDLTKAVLTPGELFVQTGLPDPLLIFDNDQINVTVHFLPGQQIHVQRGIFAIQTFALTFANNPNGTGTGGGDVTSRITLTGTSGDVVTTAAGDVNGSTFSGCEPACISGIQEFDFTNGNAFFTGISAQLGQFSISPFPTNGLSISTFDLLVESDGGTVDLSLPAQLAPEASTVMLVGLGVLGAMARYRQAKRSR